MIKKIEYTLLTFLVSSPLYADSTFEQIKTKLEEVTGQVPEIVQQIFFVLLLISMGIMLIDKLKWIPIPRTIVNHSENGVAAMAIIYVVFLFVGNFLPDLSLFIPELFAKIGFKK